MSGSSERIVGWLLLLTGTALVVSIAWAAIGFLFLGLALILLQIAEHKRRKMQPVSTWFNAAVQQARPPNISEDQPGATYDNRPRVETKLSPESQQVWIILAELDPQILRLADALTPFGQRYVDQLAAACFAASEATQFPEIARRIVALALAEQVQVARATSDWQSSQDNEQRPLRTILPIAKTAPDGLVAATPATTPILPSRPLSRSDPAILAMPLAEQEDACRTANHQLSSQDNDERQWGTVLQIVKDALDGRDGMQIQRRPIAASRPLRSEPPVEQQPPQRKEPADNPIAKAFPIGADNSAVGEEISSQADPGAEAANASGRKLQNGSTDDDDAKNMAQMLARLNEVLTTKPDACGQSRRRNW